MRRSAFNFVVLLAAVALGVSGNLVAQETETPAIQKAEVGKTVNVHRCGSLLLAGQPTPEDIEALKKMGIKRVISLREDKEVDWDEQAAVEDAGLEFLHVPIAGADSLTDEMFDELRTQLKASDEAPTLLHCGSANRVGAVWMTYRVLDQGVPLETALAEAKEIGLRNKEMEAKAREYIERQKTQDAEPSVRPGINANFLKPDLDINEWLGKFEVESREVFTARHEIVKATGLQPGQRVADIGAGTGLFTRLFSDVVGEDGWVYAIDIAPRFVEHINEQAQKDKLANISAMLCPADSIALPSDSIEVAFVCDTYHHFEYPRSTLASIYRALRPDGTLIVIDFERVPGKSREFVLEHVRAGKEVFRAEIEAAGFQLVEEVPVDGLQENYVLRFRKQ